MYPSIKRFLDVLLSCFIFLCLSWLFIICIIVLWCTGEHYIWYFQTRIGKKNKKFKIFKFATMLFASPTMGTGTLTTRNDPRVLPFGKFLRKTKMNELPQLFNVLNGTMSMVGPRPQTEIDFNQYEEEVQAHIYDICPGITGIGSVIFRDEEYYLSQPGINLRDFYRDKIAPYKGAVELWYLSHYSLKIDIMILFLTFWVIIFPQSDLPFHTLKDLPKRPDWMRKH